MVHLARFDYLVRAALGGEDAAALVRNGAWQAEFGSGFPRELHTLDPGIDVPEPPPLDAALALLDAQTRATLALLDSGIDFTTMRSFPDDDDLFTTGAAQVVQAARLALWIPMHDRYHRGHITHTKYDYTTSR
nr:DinB family protein [Glycomyces sp. YM15]